MLVFLGILCVLSCTLSAAEDERPVVDPEYLNMLRRNGQHEEFARLLGIDDVSLVMPTSEKSDDPLNNKDLLFGDILPLPKVSEESRQALNFDRYTGMKWPNGEIPVGFVAGDFTDKQVNDIVRHIQHFNSKRTNVQIRWFDRNKDRDYVAIFNGKGCYSYLGKIGGQQALSLQANGCIYQGVVQHEFIHAAGFTHEQNRSDRDKYIRMKWENIPPEWQSQYQKVNPDDYVNVAPYDYYSIMHYPVLAPGTNKPAYDVLQWGIDANNIGNKNDLSETDILKIRKVYSK